MHRLAEYNVPIFTLNAIGQIIVKPPKFNVQKILNSVNITKIYKSRITLLPRAQRQ